MKTAEWSDGSTAWETCRHDWQHAEQGSSGIENMDKCAALVLPRAISTCIQPWTHAQILVHLYDPISFRLYRYTLVPPPHILEPIPLAFYIPLGLISSAIPKIRRLLLRLCACQRTQIHGIFAANVWSLKISQHFDARHSLMSSFLRRPHFPMLKFFEYASNIPVP